jgi:FdhD protein
VKRAMRHLSDVKRGAFVVDHHPAELVDVVPLTRFAGRRSRRARDAVAREEPLEIQLDGSSLAVIMRTPGHDEELGLGLLLSERVIGSLDDVASVHHSTVAQNPESADNILQIRLREGVPVNWERLKRSLYASASCGVCGKATLDSVLAQAPALEDRTRFRASLFPPLPERLRRAQEAFAATGGLHAAGLFDVEGRLFVVREDIGRHNAVDKVIGWALERGRLPLSAHLLLVSGRISYEIAAKALAARIPVVAAVSAPSSLAVALAERARLTLIAFLRGQAFNVYGERTRIVAE